VSLDANNLLDHDHVDLTELERLSDDRFLVMAKATTKRDGGGHESHGDQNDLQTLHGLLSFG
jgi:hypothetical protein